MTSAADISEELLTAYALGELEGEERDRVIAHVATDEGARLFVESIRATGERLAWELPAENRSALLPAHRAAIEEHLYGPPPALAGRGGGSRRRRLFTFLAAVAASAAVVTGGFVAAIRSLDRTAEARVAYGPADDLRIVPTAPRLAGEDPASQPTHAPSGTGGFAAATTQRPPFAPGALPMVAYGPGYPYSVLTGYAPFVPVAPYPTVPLDPAASSEPASAGTGSFAGLTENVFLPVARLPLSSFPASADAASWSDVRWYLAQNMPPPPDTVRIEEMVNAFRYAYVPPAPDDGSPFAANVEVAGCPWAQGHRLVRVALKAREADDKPNAAAAIASSDETAVPPPTVARDVRVQVEFNPAVVAAYRLIGFENRVPAPNDLFDDSKLAADVGPGHAVTALYELIPVGGPDAPANGRLKAPELRYQKPPAVPADVRGETLTVRVRYRDADGPITRLLEFPVTDHGASYTGASEDFKFAAAVASYGMILRCSPHRGASTFAGVADLARQGLGRDEGSARAEFIALVQKTKALTGAP
jgi:hypothetical protein